MIRILSPVGEAEPDEDAAPASVAGPARRTQLTSLQGAVLGVKLARLRAWTVARRQVAARYLELLDGMPLTRRKTFAMCGRMTLVG